MVGAAGGIGGDGAGGISGEAAAVDALVIVEDVSEAMGAIDEDATEDGLWKSLSLRSLCGG